MALKKIKTKTPTIKEIKERLERLETMIEDNPNPLATFSSDDERLAFTLGIIECLRWILNKEKT